MARLCCQNLLWGPTGYRRQASWSAGPPKCLALFVGVTADHLRLINAGAIDTLVFGLAGHKLTVTNTDGNPLLTPAEVDGVPLGVGGSG